MARERFKSDNPVVVGGGDRLPFADASLDKVVTNNVPIGKGRNAVGAYVDPDEIKRVLKPEGEWAGSSSPLGREVRDPDKGFDYPNQ